MKIEELLKFINNGELIYKIKEHKEHIDNMLRYINARIDYLEIEYNYNIPTEETYFNNIQNRTISNSKINLGFDADTDSTENKFSL